MLCSIRGGELALCLVKRVHDSIDTKPYNFRLSGKLMCHHHLKMYVNQSRLKWIGDFSGICMDSFVGCQIGYTISIYLASLVSSTLFSSILKVYWVAAYEIIACRGIHLCILKLHRCIFAYSTSFKSKLQMTSDHATNSSKETKYWLLYITVANLQLLFKHANLYNIL